MKKFALFVLLIFGGCKEQSTDLPLILSGAISLTIVDVSSTELWLKLSMPDTLSGRNFTLYRNNTPVRSGAIWGKDTLLSERDLQPKQSYAYHAVRGDGNLAKSTNTVSITTTDTTSHDYTWTAELIGEGYSFLRDAFILNDSCIYAAGEMYVNGATGAPDIANPHCLARWDGQKWELKKLRFFNPRIEVGNPYSLISDGFGVLAFSPTDVWIASGGVFRWNGVDTLVTLSSTLGGVRKLWGTSPTNIYGVGDGGTISHYDGTSWKPMASGTTVELTDIHGSLDGKEVWACGYNATDGNSVLLRLSNGQWETIWRRNTTVPPFFPFGFRIGLWVDSGVLVSVGFGVDRNFLFNISSSRQDLSNIDYFPRAGMAGSARNNLAIAGDFGMVQHWNGATWKFYTQFLNQGGEGQDYGIAVSEKQIVVVGYRDIQFPYSKAFVLRGKR